MPIAMLSLALAVLLFTVPAGAADRLVDDGGVRCIGGSLPLHTSINEAVSVAGSGETILVCPGAYAERVRVLTDGLTIQAAGVVTLETPGGDPGFWPDTAFLVTSKAVTIQGFDISGFPCGIHVYGAGATIRGNRVHGNSQGICVQSGSGGGTLTDNVVEDNELGIMLDLVIGMEISGNIIRNNLGYGLHGFTVVVATTVHHNLFSGNWAGLWMRRPFRSVIRNNTFLDHATTAIELQIGDDAVVTRNLVHSSWIGMLIDGNSCTVSFNAISFSRVGLWLQYSDGCTISRNNVTRSDQVDCRWDGWGTNTFLDNACGTETPPGAWD